MAYATSPGPGPGPEFARSDGTLPRPIDDHGLVTANVAWRPGPLAGAYLTSTRRPGAGRV